MMRSLFSGVSGLRVHQNRMDVIGNNIANVNTVGFKASRMTFADAMLQRISGASADNPDTGRAGRNPMQIGLGVNIGGIDNLMTQGAAQRTDRPLDLTIQGEGFFVVSDASGTFFTRSGIVDWNGHRFSIGGMQLMGWPAVEIGPGNVVIQPGTVQPLETPPTVLFMDPRPTTMIDAMGNLNVEDAIPTAVGNEIHLLIRRPVEFYDTLGNRYVADMTFRYHPSPNVAANMDPQPTVTDMPYQSNNERSIWTFDFDGPSASVPFPPGVTEWPEGAVVVYPMNDRDNPIVVQMGINTEAPTAAEFPGNLGGGVLAFSPLNGRLIGVGEDYASAIDPPPGTTVAPGGALPRGPQEIILSFNTSFPLFPPAIIGAPTTTISVPGNHGNVVMNFEAVRQQGQQRTNFQAERRDGNAPGTLQDIMVGPDGIITGRYSNGATRKLGQIPLAFFRNPAGLERMGNNLWQTTQNSGWFDGVGFHGDMMPGTLEMSNVDLSSEFTEMITTQRGFQANSRIITTSDEMLMELVNLKR